MARKSDYMRVAETIREQIGPMAFMMMGAKDLVGGDGGLGTLRFKIGRGAKDGITHIQITLDPSDTYTVTFMRYRNHQMKTIDEVPDVYTENLHSVISSHTGFALSLGRRRNPDKGWWQRVDWEQISSDYRRGGDVWVLHGEYYIPGLIKRITLGKSGKITVHSYDGRHGFELTWPDVFQHRRMLTEEEFEKVYGTNTGWDRPVLATKRVR